MMLDPYNALVTFGDAVKLGRACDEAEYFWYEDPFLDMGTSMFAHPQAPASYSAHPS